MFRNYLIIALRNRGEKTTRQRMAGEMLGRTARRAVAKQTMYDSGLHLIVKRRRRAVSVDVPHVARSQPGHFQRHRDRPFRPEPFRMWRRHVPRIGRFTDAEQCDLCRFAGQ